MQCNKFEKKNPNSITGQSIRIMSGRKLMCNRDCILMWGCFITTVKFEYFGGVSFVDIDGLCKTSSFYQSEFVFNWFAPVSISTVDG